MKQVIILVLVIFVLSCQNSESEKVQQLERRIDSLTKVKEPQISIREIADKIDAAKSAPVSETAKESKKYCYVYVETIEPEIKYLSNSLPNVPGEYSAVPKFYYYASDIREVNNFSEDEKYKLIDSYENKIRREMFVEKDLQLKPYNVECKIQSKKCYAFNTYKEASEHRTSMRQ